MRTPPDSNVSVSRRVFLGGAAAACAGASLTVRPALAGPAVPPPNVPPEDYRVRNGRIKQSVFEWCFQPMPAGRLIDACHRMGIPAMDVSPAHYPRLRALGMKVAMVSSHDFKIGPFSAANHRYCLAKLRAAVDLAVRWDCPRVITFTGAREKGISDQQGARNCVECWKQAIAYAEPKGVNLCLEMLNTRDTTHPMKGHPGCFGNDVELCIDLIKRVDSPRMKFLFDVYHVQIMNGDVIRRIRQYKDYIAHYHVAGVPGRGELDDTQEINYPAVMRAILQTGYTGYVSQEFIPTWPDKLAALRHAVQVCDV